MLPICPLSAESSTEHSLPPSIERAVCLPPSGDRSPRGMSGSPSGGEDRPCCIDWLLSSAKGGCSTPRRPSTISATTGTWTAPAETPAGTGGVSTASTSPLRVPSRTGARAGWVSSPCDEPRLTAPTATPTKAPTSAPARVALVAAKRVIVLGKRVGLWLTSQHISDEPSCCPTFCRFARPAAPPLRWGWSSFWVHRTRR